VFQPSFILFAKCVSRKRARNKQEGLRGKKLFMEEYFCNSCLEQFKPGDEGAGLRCAHLLCRKCSEKELASEPLACPICRTVCAAVVLDTINLFEEYF
jgi:hypothetical protein